MIKRIEYVTQTSKNLQDWADNLQHLEQTEKSFMRMNMLKALVNLHFTEYKKRIV